VQLKPAQLEDHLANTLASCYLVSGDEPLIVSECADAIRRKAREAGCTERQRISISGKDDWLELGHIAGALSLFAERKLIEILLPSGKPGTEGSRALMEHLESEPTGDVLLVISGRIDKQSQKSKWYTAMDRVGAVIPVWPVSPTELPGWIGQRMRRAGMKADAEAIALLAERVEGNLLAAAQEIEKLRLLHPEQTLSAAQVADTVSDNARYDAFRLVDVALSGDARSALRTLRGLRAEAVQPPVLLWAIAREVRLLTDIKRDMATGGAASSAMNQHGVWRNRQPLVQAALQRLSGRDLAELQALSFEADGTSKGFLLGDAWDVLENLVVLLAQGGAPAKMTERRA